MLSSKMKYLVNGNDGSKAHNRLPLKRYRHFTSNIFYGLIQYLNYSSVVSNFFVIIDALLSLSIC